MNLRKASAQLLSSLGLIVLAQCSHAQITFDWSISTWQGFTDSGKFITTTGTETGGAAPAGTYDIASVLITQSQSDPTMDGASTGDGKIIAGRTSFNWDGSVMTSGPIGWYNPHNPMQHWGIGGGQDINDTYIAGYATEGYSVTVDATPPASTPEPGGIAMVGGVAFAGLAALRRRRIK